MSTVLQPVCTPVTTDAPAPPYPLAELAALERKALWLSTWLIHNANHLRPARDGLKVGGHQSSSASVSTLMTALYFHALRPQDRIAVKPHASPVMHAIQYLLGRQTQDQLERFRAQGGAQSYPSRTKDKVEVDFSTGSVGLGVAATLFASLVQDYVVLHGLTAPVAAIMPHGFAHMQADDGGSTYLRLSTRKLDQLPREMTPALRDDVVAGGYWLRAPHANTQVAIAYCGAVAPEAMEASHRLAERLPNVGVLAVTSPDRLHAGWTAARRARAGATAPPPATLTGSWRSCPAARGSSPCATATRPP